MHIHMHNITCSPTLTTKCLSTSGLPKQNQQGPFGTGGFLWFCPVATKLHYTVTMTTDGAHQMCVSLDYYLCEPWHKTVKLCMYAHTHAHTHMHTHTHTHTHMHTHTRARTHTCIWTCTHARTHARTHTHTHTHTHMHTRTYTHAHTRTHTHTHTHVRAHIHTCTHAHTHTQSLHNKQYITSLVLLLSLVTGNWPLIIKEVLSMISRCLYNAHV